MARFTLRRKGSRHRRFQLNTRFRSYAYRAKMRLYMLHNARSYGPHKYEGPSHAGGWQRWLP